MNIFYRDKDGALKVAEDFLEAALRDAKYVAENGSSANKIAYIDGISMSEEFRKSFPNVSDTDIGSILLTIAAALSNLYQFDEMSIKKLIKASADTYTYCSLELLRTDYELKGL